MAFIKIPGLKIGQIFSTNMKNLKKLKILQFRQNRYDPPYIPSQIYGQKIMAFYRLKIFSILTTNLKIKISQFLQNFQSMTLVVTQVRANTIKQKAMYKKID